MKKLIHIVIILGLLLAIFPIAAAAHTEDDPLKTDLIAGQNEDAGDVLVWNDTENLYVQYKLHGSWCLLETHVAVGVSSEDIPQTKKGNPIPGKFEYSAEYSNPPCVQNPDPYVIPNVWDDEQLVYIAAHASVSKPVDGCFEEVWQIGDVETVDDETGLLENYADEFNWGIGAGPVTMGPSLAQEKPAFSNPFIVGSPIEEFPFNSNTAYEYATDFDVQWDGSLPFGGQLTISWSPGQSASEQKVLSNSFPAATFNATGTASIGQGYFMDKYSLVENTVSMNPVGGGTHTINFKHTKGDGTFWDWLRLEKVCEQNETGWGKGEEFDGSNWGMYIEYTIQGPPPPPPMVCPEITGQSPNVEVLGSPPEDVRVGAFENDNLVRVWQEFKGPLPTELAYDLEEGNLATNGVPSPKPGPITSGTKVCIYYVHLDNVGPSSTIQHSGYIEFEGEISGLVISGGDLGDFAGENLMFAADNKIGYPGTAYPGQTGTNYWRGFDVNYGSNLDDAVFSGSKVEFTMWVVNAHDSMRVILPLVPDS